MSNNNSNNDNNNNNNNNNIKKCVLLRPILNKTLLFKSFQIYKEMYGSGQTARTSINFTVILGTFEQLYLL